MQASLWLIFYRAGVSRVILSSAYVVAFIDQDGQSVSLQCDVETALSCLVVICCIRLFRQHSPEAPAVPPISYHGPLPWGRCGVMGIGRVCGL